jgi:hypothetical protein
MCIHIARRGKSVSWFVAEGFLMPGLNRYPKAYYSRDDPPV